MKLNDQKKIEDMLNECHKDLSFIASSMGKSDALSNIFYLNIDSSPQYEVVTMIGYHFISKATDFAVNFYNNNVVLAKSHT